jgi:predicted dithiol-disulfide oxidoreductase (DUF899 family)
MTDSTALQPNVVSPTEWLTARKELLLREKRFTRERDALNAARRALPWTRVTKAYRFEGERGVESLAELFAGRSQLIVYHFMFAPGWREGCPSCSFLADHVDGTLPHLAAPDVTFVAVSRAALPQLLAFRQRMGWRFKWVSSHGGDFNYDFHVSSTAEQRSRGRMLYNYGETAFSGEELHGASVFCKDAAGALFHAYSSYARGCEALIGTYNWLDLVPKGRDEDGLAFSMGWVRHHDRYGAGYAVDANAPYVEPKDPDSCCGSADEHRG